VTACGQYQLAAYGQILLAAHHSRDDLVGVDQIDRRFVGSSLARLDRSE
jgi:hypothetical protein